MDRSTFIAALTFVNWLATLAILDSLVSIAIMVYLEFRRR